MRLFVYPVEIGFHRRGFATRASAQVIGEVVFVIVRVKKPREGQLPGIVDGLKTLGAGGGGSKAGKSMAARIAMSAMTTSSSIR